MLKKTLISVIALPILLTGFAQPAFAVSTPDFGSCLNPQVAASQVNNGSNHGVVGRTTPYSGTDSIYNLSNDNVLQCLCPDNGSGVQTNWLKISDMSDSDVKALESDGWIYVSTGSSWGLKDVPYLAKNIEYSCKGSTNSTSNSTSSSSSTSNVIVSVLALASTGNMITIYGLILAGIISLFAGLLLKKVSK